VSEPPQCWPAQSSLITETRGIRKAKASQLMSSDCTAAAALTGRIHFHDLRRTGNTWAAEAGAMLRELMDRMEHASTRAALICVHSRDDRHKGGARPGQNW
jgi:integrase